MNERTFEGKAAPARVTPAMEAGITDHVWTIEEILGKVS